MNLKDFAAQMDTFQKQQSDAIDGLTGDVKSLSDKITQLQSSAADDLSEEDSATLSAIAATAANVASRLAALDNMTPPTVPVPPTVQG